MKIICEIILLSTFLVWYGSTTEFSRKGVKNSIVIDDLQEDDHDEFELSDIIALAMSTVDVSEDFITPEDRQKNVDLHNALRMNYTYPFPEASNMNMLEHNNTLEWTAVEYQKYCKWENFFADDDNMSYIDYGQINYRGMSRDVSQPIYIFYHVQYPWWFFNNKTCLEPYPKYDCDHFLQLMLAITKHIGFSRKSNCFPLLDNNKWFITIHYLPGGTFSEPEEFIYHYGSPCSMCEPGFLCSNGLCVPDPERFCKAYNLDCECKLVCQNCATLDSKNCKCSECKAGWDFSDCSFPCINYGEVVSYENCKRLSCGKFFPLQANLIADVKCRKKCKKCIPLTESTKPDETCCGKICDPFYVLDVETCECTMRCPSYLCLYPPTTTSTTTTTTTSTSTTSTSTSITTTTASPTIISSVTSPKHPIGKEPQPDVVSTAFKILPKSMTNVWLIFIVFVTFKKFLSHTL